RFLMKYDAEIDLDVALNDEIEPLCNEKVLYGAIKDDFSLSGNTCLA
ncbi:12618_t:CDS:1, partial [Entrophospora sp. SA101]